MRGRQRYTYIIGLFSIGIFLLSFFAHAQQSDWNSKMRELSKAMSEALPELYAGSAPLNREQFKDKVRNIYFISRDIDESAHHGAISNDKDITIPYLSHLFREEIERAYWSLESGNDHYAKGVVRSSVSYCIACHTRTEMGPQFPLIASLTSKSKWTSWIDRVSFLAASRQFDGAYDEVLKQLKSSELPSDIKANDLEKSLNIALSISVRVKQNADLAEALAVAASNSKHLAPDVKKRAAIWINDIQQWKKEKKPDLKTADSYMVAARKLVGKLMTNGEMTWIHGNEVRFLRSSVLMHELLARYPASPDGAEALYLIGISYDVLQDLGIWSLHDMYYQACIERKPHSDVARRCYERYKESVTLGYSGSGGVRIPGSVQIQMSRLERLANPIVYYKSQTF